MTIKTEIEHLRNYLEKGDIKGAITCLDQIDHDMNNIAEFFLVNFYPSYYLTDEQVNI